MRLLHKALTYDVRGCIYKVHNELKTGFDEESYQVTLEHYLAKNNLSFQSKPSKILEHRGKKVHKFIPDLIIEDKLILELKNLQAGFIPANFVQILSYLKHWQKDLGFLVNFCRPSAEIERVLFFERDLIVAEDVSEIEDFIFSPDGQYFKQAKLAILNIFEIHGLSYDYTIYKTLFKLELDYLNIPYTPSVLMPVKSDGQLLRNFELKIPLIANKILCGITAGQTDLKIHITTMRNYLRKGNIPIGIIANFGNKKLEIIGVHSKHK